VRQEVLFRLLALELAKPGREDDLANTIAARAEGLRQKPEETKASA
jgi:hypothetical protein